MVSLRLPDAVIVWLDPRRRDFGVKLVESVPQALALYTATAWKRLFEGISQSFGSQLQGRWYKPWSIQIQPTCEQPMMPFCA
jgi:hypothetical protein